MNILEAGIDYKIRLARAEQQFRDRDLFAWNQ